MGRTIGKGVLLDYDRMHRQAAEALESLGHPEIDVRMEAGKLGVGQQQMSRLRKRFPSTQS
jgi:ribose transport system ATP-binding protein